MDDVVERTISVFWSPFRPHIVALGWTTLIGMLAVKFRSGRPGTSTVICSVGGKRTLTFGNDGFGPVKTGYWLSISPTYSIKGGK